MSAALGNGFAIDRVIAVLDASSSDVEPLMAAADIAARLGTEVLGLFIEDMNLLRLMSLPAARHVAIGPAAGGWDIDSLEREMRALAARAEAELGAVATRIGVRWSFRVVRGLPSVELATATVAHDLLVLGSARPPAGLPLRLDSPVHAAARQIARSLLLVPRRTRLARPLIVAQAGSPQMLQALAAGSRLAHGRDLDVFLIGAPSAQIDGWAAARGHGLHTHARGTLSAAQLEHLVRGFGSDVVILTPDLAMVSTDDGIDDLARQADCQVLVVQ
jgi:hypothetical protein